MVVSPAVSTLLENPPAVFLKSSDLLITCADNMRHPGDECHIDKESLNFLRSTRGAMECLNEMGFESEIVHRFNLSSFPLWKFYLVFPRSASVEQLRLIRESIAEEVRIRECIAVLEQSPPQTNPSSGQGPLVTPPALSPANTSALATSVPVPQNGPTHYNYMEHIGTALLENPLDDFLKSSDLLMSPAVSDEFLKYSDLVISETRTMEFKRRSLGSYSDVLSRYTSVFLNTGGGQLLFGVGNNVNSKQQEDEYRLQVDNILKRSNPPVFPQDLEVLPLTFTRPPGSTRRRRKKR